MEKDSEETEKNSEENEEDSEKKLSRKEKKEISKMRIITAISLGKDRNKEIAKFLDTDKSFAAKKVKELEDEGLIIKEGEGRHTRYTLNKFNALTFLKSKVIITKGGKKHERKKHEDKSS